MAERHPRLPPASDVDRDEELKRLHLAQRISRVGSWNYDVVAPALTVSDVLLELYGLNRSAFNGMYEVLNNCVHPDSRASVVEATQRLTQTGVPMTIRYPVIRATMARCVGSTRTELSSATLTASSRKWPALSRM